MSTYTLARADSKQNNKNSYQNWSNPAFLFLIYYYRKSEFRDFSE